MRGSSARRTSATASTSLTSPSSSFTSPSTAWIVRSPLLLLCIAALVCTAQPLDSQQPQQPIVAAASRNSPAPHIGRHPCFMGKCPTTTHNSGRRTVEEQRQTELAALHARGSQLAKLPPGETQAASCEDGTDAEYQYGWWTQKNDNNKETGEQWRQQFQVQDRYFLGNESESIIIIQIGGEGFINPKWVCNDAYTHMKAAAKHRALVVQVEHRFFGYDQSDIINDGRTPQLELLTVDQALADLDVFIKEFGARYENPKFVLFGGSYPGTMAALHRQQYPDSTVGAIASSAPLWPIADYYQYAEVMEKAYDQFPRCKQKIKDAYALMNDNLLTSSGRASLNEKFNFDKPFADDAGQDTTLPTWENIYTVSQEMFNAFQGMAQYSYDGAAPQFYHQAGPHKNVDYACQIMKDEQYNDDLLAALYQVYIVSAASDPANPESRKVQNNFENANAPLRETQFNKDYENPGHDEGVIMRGWMWLSCNQFGWLQSTTNSDTFGPAVPIDYYEKVCFDLFGVKFEASKMAATASKYGNNKNFKASNLYLSNGEYDPWSALGVTTNDDENNVFTHVTARAAHVSDFYAEYDGEPSGLYQARDILHKQVDKFLGRENGVPPVPGSGGEKPDPGNGNNPGQTTTPNSGATFGGAALSILTTTAMILFTRM